jgi:hypothetical protein
MKKSIDLIRKTIEELHKSAGDVPTPGHVTVKMKADKQVSVPEYLVKKEVEFFKEIKNLNIGD